MVALDVQKMLYLLVVEQVASSSVQCYVTEIFVCWFALTFSKSLARHLRASGNAVSSTALPRR